MTSRDLEIVKGDSKGFNLIFQEAGVAIDITDWTIYFTVKVSKGDLDSAAVISKDVTVLTDPTHGNAKIELTSIDTNITANTYYYDIRVVTKTGAVYTLMMGKLTILAAVTSRI